MLGSLSLARPTLSRYYDGLVAPLNGNKSLVDLCGEREGVRLRNHFPLGLFRRGPEMLDYIVEQSGVEEGFDVLVRVDYYKRLANKGEYFLKGEPPHQIL